MYARNIASSSALHRCPATPCLLHRCLLCQRLPLLHLCPQNEVRLLPHVCNNFAPNRASAASSPRCCRLCNMLSDVASDTTFASTSATSSDRSTVTRSTLSLLAVPLATTVSASLASLDRCFLCRSHNDQICLLPFHSEPFAINFYRWLIHLLPISTGD
ncbi:hypothetical protein BHM03_00045455, partial [Ensete ventricosum]